MNRWVAGQADETCSLRRLLVRSCQGLEEPTPHQQTSGSDEDHRTEVHQDPNMPPNKQSINPHIDTARSEAELLQVLKNPVHVHRPFNRLGITYGRLGVEITA